MLTPEELERYARHIVLREVGGPGQQALGRARVLVIGAGGLGAPLLLYLGAAGVGTLGVVDDDTVDLSNLQRQVIHDETTLGLPKVASAQGRLAKLNPDIKVVTHQERLNAENVERLLADYDIIADGSDNFRTRYLLNDICFKLKKTLVSAALLRFDGQLSTYKAHLGAGHPCYRCIFPEQPPADLIPRCEEAGIFGAVAGVMGCLQATEVLKEILGLGDSLSGKLMIYDALAPAFRTVRIAKDPDCPCCSKS
jgi:molybdopterin/thiamine biosynthesis adenylyltransferase